MIMHAMARVEIITDDGVTIVGTYHEGGKDGPAALLLHMMPATKESWRTLVEALKARGFSTLAIDLRGHGESVLGQGGKRLDHKLFSDAEHQAKANDVDVAVRWLEAQGRTRSRMAVVGASIGANLAISFAAADHQVPATVALSPGLDYRGVKTADPASSMPRSQKLLLAASEDDEYSFHSIRELSKIKTDAEVQELKDAGHGTTMLEREPSFLQYVVEWIVNNVH